MLPKQAIDEFKELFKEEYNVQLSDEEATEKAISVFNLVKMLANR